MADVGAAPMQCRLVERSQEAILSLGNVMAASWGMLSLGALFCTDGVIIKIYIVAVVVAGKRHSWHL